MFHRSRGKCKPLAHIAAGRGLTAWVCLALLAAAGSTSAFGEPLRVGPVRAELLSEASAIAAGQTFTVGVHLVSNPDWHTYWKYPGDSGLPTTLEWHLPPGFAAGPIQWPVPQRIETLGDVTYGYPGDVMLLVDITPPARLWQKQATLAVTVSWLACRIECTPGKAELTASVPIGTGAPAPDPSLIGAFRRARQALPSSAPAGMLTATSTPSAVQLRILGLQAAAAQVAFYPASAGQIDLKAPQTTGRTGPDRVLTLRRAAGTGQRLTGILVVSDGGSTRALDVDLPVSAAPAAGLGILLALVLAFIGGVILNLMPCVLPVVSLKVLGLVRHAPDGHSSAIGQGLLFAAGVLVSFWAIAAVLLALRAGGQSLGWGFQFQNPVVVAIAAALFFLIGASLFGLFELRAFAPRASAPRAFAPRAISGPRTAGSFLSGLFATAVATPCTAPFMGAALGYALGQPLPVAFGVFTALGIGMAAPYVVLSAAPGLSSRLPKPGPWMETLKQILGFPMMAAVIWMLFVLAALSGPSAVIAALCALLVCGLGAWIWRRWGTLDRGRATRAVALALGLALVIGSTAWAAVFASGSRAVAAPTSLASEPAASWQPWSPEREAELRSSGTPVLVDFSARWCLSCQVNERVALYNPSVLKRLQELGTASLKADWTDNDPRVAKALALFGRASVPLYVLYPAGGAQPVLLPEILTPGIVLSALERARSP